MTSGTANTPNPDPLLASKTTTDRSPVRASLRPNAHVAIASVAALLALVTASECSSIAHLPSLVYGVVLWGWWAVVASLLWSSGSRSTSLTDFSPRAIPLHLVVAAILGGLHLLCLWGLGFTALRWQGNLSPQSVGHYLFNLNRYGLEILIYGFLFGITGVIRHQIRAQRQAMKSLELQRQLSDAHLRALQMQLEPHFLFNTLNAITTLVELGRQAEAVEMLGHLNTILKTTLHRDSPEKIRLSEELELVENYLAIEQARFADRLRIEIKIEPAALDSLVPCFLLQPIVENAIRHGVAHCESEGLVEASARRDGDTLRLRVRDTGAGWSDPGKPGNGIGLKNTRERLVHFYQDAFDMKTGPLENGGFEVAIAIPYERP